MQGKNPDTSSTDKNRERDVAEVRLISPKKKAERSEQKALLIKIGRNFKIS